MDLSLQILNLYTAARAACKPTPTPNWCLPCHWPVYLPNGGITSHSNTLGADNFFPSFLPFWRFERVTFVLPTLFHLHFICPWSSIFVSHHEYNR